MENDQTINSYIRQWYEHDRKNPDNDRHLSDETLYAMAQTRGLKSASQDDLDHFSLCPVCMEKWSGHLKPAALTNSPRMEADDYFMTWGTAMAASDELFEPVTLESGCKRFRLVILPDMEEIELGKAELLPHPAVKEAHEGRHATVRDKNGRIILKGRIRGGRLARRINALSKLDLQKWTIVIQPSTNSSSD